MIFFIASDISWQHGNNRVLEFPECNTPYTIYHKMAGKVVSARINPGDRTTYSAFLAAVRRPDVNSFKNRFNSVKIDLVFCGERSQFGLAVPFDSPTL
jgi:hypothetical protein